MTQRNASPKRGTEQETGMSYQWYPGHMTKTLRQIEEQLRLIDLVVEVVDARIPASSRNPEVDRIAKNKVRMILLGKADLADEEETARWIRWYRSRGWHPYPCDLRKASSVRSLGGAMTAACHEKAERDRKKGMKPRPIRAMVMGIPNAGKSTLINSLSGSSSLRTGNRPGVTKGRQWISVGRSIQLMDTPGLLWPKFEDETAGRHIAFIGSMPDTILDTTELACELLAELTGAEPWRNLLTERYGIDTSPYLTGGPGGHPDTAGLLTAIGERRGALRRGGAVDLEKASSILLDDFRSGRIGRITLEAAPDTEKSDDTGPDAEAGGEPEKEGEE